MQEATPVSAQPAFAPNLVPVPRLDLDLAPTVPTPDPVPAAAVNRAPALADEDYIAPPFPDAAAKANAVINNHKPCHSLQFDQVRHGVEATHDENMVIIGDATDKEFCGLVWMHKRGTILRQSVRKRKKPNRLCCNHMGKWSVH